MVGAPVGGDDEVGLEIGADRLDQDVDLVTRLPSPLVVSPTTQRTVSPADTDGELLARLEGDVESPGRRRRRAGRARLA